MEGIVTAIVTLALIAMVVSGSGPSKKKKPKDQNPERDESKVGYGSLHSYQAGSNLNFDSDVLAKVKAHQIEREKTLSLMGNLKLDDIGKTSTPKYDFKDIDVKKLQGNIGEMSTREYDRKLEAGTKEMDYRQFRICLDSAPRFGRRSN
ncbi:MAG: hypothetical protein GY867_08220 [bacterium]|nr:hypothetical protein [bacterium]